MLRCPCHEVAAGADLWRRAIELVFLENGYATSVGIHAIENGTLLPEQPVYTPVSKSRTRSFQSQPADAPASPAKLHK